MSRNRPAGALLAALALISCSIAPAEPRVEVEVSGELKRWHPLTITFEGPEVSETGEPNPFRDYRLNVSFRHEETGEGQIVPGYFAADGNAADTGADAGSRWRVHFTPGRTGAWTYEASFRTGTDVALISLTHFWDWVGFPVVALPAGLGSVRGLPVGISLIGAAATDRELLSLGIELQQALPPPAR